MTPQYAIADKPVHSSITNVEGLACYAYTRVETVARAISDAKRKAAEFAAASVTVKMET